MLCTMMVMRPCRVQRRTLDKIFPELRKEEMFCAGILQWKGKSHRKMFN